MHYTDFVIHFERENEEQFRVRVLDSPAGQGRETLDLSPLFQDHQQLRSALFGQTAAPQIEPAKRIGRELFRLLFRDQVRALYDQSTGMLSEHEERCLRLVLRLDPTDIRLAVLYSLPWELLYKPETSEFLALSRTCSIVRHLEVPRPARTMPLPFPLRVLILFSSPRGLAPLDLGGERLALEAVLSKHPGIEVHTLNRATVEELRGALLAETFHVVHFIGHGGFSSETGDGALFLESDDGSPALVTGTSLAILLRDFTTIRLVLLNACETARATSADRANPFSGVATALVLSGVPAVVAMQFPISDSAATVFSSTFYSRLTEGDPVDTAVTEGRVAIFSRVPRGLEWATPALFSRVPGGSVFVVQRENTRDVSGIREAGKTVAQPEVEEVEQEDDAVNQAEYIVLDRGNPSRAGTLEQASISTNGEGKFQMTALREKIENNLVVWLLSTLLAGFLAGIGTYKTILEIAQLEVIPKAKLERLQSSTSVSRQDGAGSGGSPRVTTEYNTDRSGGDFKDFPNATLEECKDACLEEERCRSYTYDNNPESSSYGRCFLKAAVAPPRYKLGDISGVKEP